MPRTPSHSSSGFGDEFFRWYNNEHHHSGLGLLTPGDIHFSLAE
jgi:putative transposase